MSADLLRRRRRILDALANREAPNLRDYHPDRDKAALLPAHHRGEGGRMTDVGRGPCNSYACFHSLPRCDGCDCSCHTTERKPRPQSEEA